MISIRCECDRCGFYFGNFGEISIQDLVFMGAVIKERRNIGLPDVLCKRCSIEDLKINLPQPSNPKCNDPKKACPTCGGFGFIKELPFTTNELVELESILPDKEVIISEKICPECNGEGK